MKTEKMPSTAQVVFSLVLYYLSFRRIKTRSLRRKAAIYTQKRWQEKLEMQKALDAEHSTGRGIRFLDGKPKFYEPYTAATLQTN